eukprot:5911301-Prymnesium_polylepis.1
MIVLSSSAPVPAPPARPAGPRHAREQAAALFGDARPLKVQRRGREDEAVDHHHVRHALSSHKREQPLDVGVYVGNGQLCPVQDRRRPDDDVGRRLGDRELGELALPIHLTALRRRPAHDGVLRVEGPVAAAGRVLARRVDGRVRRVRVEECELLERRVADIEDPAPPRMLRHGVHQPPHRALLVVEGVNKRLNARERPAREEVARWLPTAARCRVRREARARVRVARGRGLEPKRIERGGEPCPWALAQHDRPHSRAGSARCCDYSTGKARAQTPVCGRWPMLWPMADVVARG